MTDIPVGILHDGIGMETAFQSWLASCYFMVGYGVIAWGIAKALPLPIVEPGEAIKSFIGIQLREYDYRGVMSDTRRLLFIIGTIHLGLAYYLSTGGQSKVFGQDEYEWLGLSIIGIIYLASEIGRAHV